MRDKLRAWNDSIIRAVRSPRFFYAVIALLVLQALWIALTARFPQAFDENYHFGLIRLHAEYGWLPFFRSQPPGASVYGPVLSDPSYLFHYAMSIPYRLLEVLTQNEALQVIGLRLINIALFVWGLFVYRKLFNELKISPALRNITLAVFVLLPIVPLLAAHINYDNLLVPLTGLLFIYTARYIQYMRGRKPAAPLVSVDAGLMVLLIGAIASVVKYAFSPIFLATLLALVGATLFYYNLARIKPKRLLGTTNRSKTILLIVLVAIAGGLCLERYGANLVQYGSPVPDCAKVLPVESCMDYSPWARDHMYSQTNPKPSPQGFAVYPFVWVWRMVYESMFTITSRTFEPWGVVYYYAFSPLRIAFTASWIGLAGGIIGIIAFWSRIRRNRPLTVLLGIITFYTLVLFVQNLRMYAHSGEAVAIHGRYLVPVFPVLLLCLAIGWHSLLTRFKRGRYEAIVLVALTLLFLQGAGISIWLVRSNPDWYWEHNQAAISANAAVKSVVDKVVYH